MTSVPAKTRCIRWEEIRLGHPAHNECFLLSRVRLTPMDSGPAGFHTHDFHEMFWILDGKGTHRHASGREEVRKGSLSFVRAEHAHSIEAVPGQRLTFINLAFPRDTFAFLEAEFPAYTGRLWQPGKTPSTTNITDAQLGWLQREACHLEDGKQSKLTLFRFLLNLLDQFVRPESDVLPENSPPWLASAYAHMHAPENLAGGVRRFAEIARRRPETLARAIRHHVGGTPSQLVNALRMNHAERELRISDRTVLDVALECGFQSTAQFYRRFQEAYGLSPGQYRRSFQGMIRGHR